MPKELEAVIIKAMQKEISKRYQSAGEMKQDLEKIPAQIFGDAIGIGNKTQEILTHTIIQEAAKKQGEGSRGTSTASGTRATITN